VEVYGVVVVMRVIQPVFAYLVNTVASRSKKMMYLVASLFLILFIGAQVLIWLLQNKETPMLFFVGIFLVVELLLWDTLLLPLCAAVLCKRSTASNVELLPLVH